MSLNFVNSFNNFKPATLTTTSSSAVDLTGFALSGLVIPASMASTSLTFQISIDDGATFVPLRDDLGNTVTVTIGNTAGYYNLRRILTLGVGQIKVIPSSVGDDTKVVTLVGQRVI
jgi:hypothetical protein